MLVNNILQKNSRYIYLPTSIGEQISISSIWWKVINHQQTPISAEKCYRFTFRQQLHIIRAPTGGDDHLPSGYPLACLLSSIKNMKKA